jgi:hypothetical protein
VVVPEEFVESRVRDETITSTASFEWSKGVIIVAELDTLRRVPIEERPLYDEASLYLALMLDLAAQRLATRYRALGDGKLREYQLQPAGEQRVDSALGEIAVVGVKRERAGKDRRTVLWCAPDLRYLPVLIIQERKGTEVLRMTLSELQGLSIP